MNNSLQVVRDIKIDIINSNIRIAQIFDAIICDVLYYLS